MSTILCATAKDYYLMHYGIKGQKWGIRRWQNEDGSLTAEGQARYNGKTNISQLDDDEKAGLMKTVKLENSINKEVADAQRRKDEDKRDILDASARVLDATARALPSGNGKYVKKDYSNLTDQQLRERISRLQLEESYGRLTGDTKYVKSGSERTREILQSAGTIVAIAGSAAALAIKIKHAMGNNGAAKVGAKAAAKTGQLLLTQSDIDEEDENSLQHHGVKGQKWGVRKYQNEDGTLTTAGKLKYLSDHNPLPPLIPTPKNVKNYVNKVNSAAKKVTKAVDKGINKVTDYSKLGINKATDYSKLGIKKTTNATKRVLDYLTHPQKIDKKIKQKVSNLAKKIDARKSLKQQAAKGKARVDNILATPVEAIQHSDCLTHHGILGMKWGIRRYQNKDGSLTSEGKMRYRNYLATNNSGYKVINEQSKNLQKELNDYKNNRDAFMKASNELYRNYEDKLRNVDYDNCYYGLLDKGIKLDYSDNQEEWKHYEEIWAKEITKTYNSFDKKDLQRCIDNFNKTKENYKHSEEAIVEKLIGKYDSLKGHTYSSDKNLLLGLEVYIQKANQNGYRFETYSNIASEGLVPDSYIKEYKGSPFAVPNWYDLQFID